MKKIILSVTKNESSNITDLSEANKLKLIKKIMVNAMPVALMYQSITIFMKKIIKYMLFVLFVIIHYTWIK